MEERHRLQSVFDGQNQKVKIFTYGDLIGFDCYGTISYFIDAKVSHRAFIAIVLPEELYAVFDNISDLTSGQFSVFSQYCPTTAQHVEHGAERNFAFAGIVNCDNSWQLWKQITYHKINSDLFDMIVEDIVPELIQRLTAMTKEVSQWEGFTKTDMIKAHFKDAFSIYKKVRKYLTLEDAISGIV